ncbi:hypothetical protein FA15DRAFT_86026 [Coprinopsis marcescibilis]|uniref:Rds1 protein n=1 Tax=Coprinopsis marcescibilis TaxID=230819 RepID=A0A5C3KLM5_COPMA|nr:hypothetical protein FA15DRAFT_86026 [Coprinopsis marcescibilis]
MKFPAVFSCFVLVLPFVSASVFTFTARADLTTSSRRADDPAGDDTTSGGDNDTNAQAVQDTSGTPTNDTSVLSLSLGLTELLAAFFDQGVSQFTKEDYASAGLPSWVYGRYVEMADHEKAHQQSMMAVLDKLGAEKGQVCQYNFTTVDNVRDFVKLSEAISEISVSATNGALRRVKNEDVIGVLASILGNEARHASWINSAVIGKNPWNTALETPMTLSQRFTVVLPLVASCPESNLPLFPQELKNFATLKFLDRIVPGQKTQIDFGSIGSDDGTLLHAAFNVGNGTYIKRVYEQDGGYYVDLPQELASKGAVFVIIVKDDIQNEGRNGLIVSDANTIAGPSLLMFPFDSEGNAEPSYDVFKFGDYDAENVH